MPHGNVERNRPGSSVSVQRCRDWRCRDWQRTETPKHGNCILTGLMDNAWSFVNRWMWDVPVLIKSWNGLPRCASKTRSWNLNCDLHLLADGQVLGPRELHQRGEDRRRRTGPGRGWKTAGKKFLLWSRPHPSFRHKLCKYPAVCCWKWIFLESRLT